MQNLIEQVLPKIIELRHKLHACPELKYEEFKTSQIVRDFLHECGYETKVIAKTGVVAILDSNKPGKTVALRADLDALPIQENSNLAFSSQHPGRMHACGHDGHTATLLAAAAVLKHCKDQFTGKIKFIFQPAEEGGAGAAAMIEAGALEDPKVDAIFGYHNMPLPLGKVGVKVGCVFAGADFFTINIIGKGAHAAFPEKSIDPIWIGASIVQALQSVVSRSIAAINPVALSVTEFHAGNFISIIPDEAKLTISLRTASPEIRIQALSKCKSIVEGIAESFGAKAEIKPISDCPPTMNSYYETNIVKTAATRLFGQSQVIDMDVPTMATEDFAFYLEKIPGSFFLVGNGEVNSTLHTPDYQFQDSVIPIAAQVLMQTALDFLRST